MVRFCFRGTQGATDLLVAVPNGIVYFGVGFVRALANGDDRSCRDAILDAVCLRDNDFVPFGILFG